ncbi:MAG: penicillin-binding protein 1A [Gammaproteobacteria bacterium]|nr:penicillin-binding protein 1A [Gammaproteobacteria bacterium]
MNPLLKLFGFALAAVFAGLTLLAAGLIALYLYLAPQLPSSESLRDVHLQVPLRVYTQDARLIGEFGEMRRIPLEFRQVPAPLVHAVLAAEDDRFYQHPGVDYQGLLRAALALVKTGEKRQGGSTITMQVARNYFLSSEKTFLRKLKEILLALRIEREFSKDEILTLYLNKIYCGNRSYGIAAAAQFYYGKGVDQLSVAQMAMIAGLPKAPSRYNPVANLERATERRNYVLDRMHLLGYLDAADYKAALAEPETAQRHALEIEVEAQHVAEMVRAEMVSRYGEDAYTGGYKVYTTLDTRLQPAANQALRAGLLEYDKRHGYRGPERHIELTLLLQPEDWTRILEGSPEVGRVQAALVLKVAAQSVTVFQPALGTLELPWAGLSWARPYIDENHRGPAPKTALEFLKPGDIVRIEPLPGNQADQQWGLSQLPAVEGALVALNPNDGAIIALAGGFDFYQSNFNRVVQAERQPGSSFKPFFYSAALEKGFTPASLVNDAPIVVEGADLGEAWRPENFGGKFIGPMRLREALAQSRNLVSIRVLRTIGIDYAIDYVTRFGFRPERLPKGLSLALGSAVATPMEMVRGFAVFANGGYQVEPYFIKRIDGPDGGTLYRADPVQACLDCDTAASVTPGLEGEVRADIEAELRRTANSAAEPAAVSGGSPAGRAALRVITAENDYLMTSMMRDVIRTGTARRALALGRSDLAGKTGTTNDQRDAWFCGFNAALAATAWIGFDKHLPLGDLETGGHAALPIWMRFMEVALKDRPEQLPEPPPGIVTLRIDPETGALARADNRQAINEVFSSEHPPKSAAEVESLDAGLGAGAPRALEQLF